MLHGVGVDGHYADRGGPLVMALVDPLVEARVVQQPGTVLLL